jgi:hypothetical protein
MSKPRKNKCPWGCGNPNCKVTMSGMVKEIEKINKKKNK